MVSVIETPSTCAQGNPAATWFLEVPRDLTIPIGGSGYLTVTIICLGYKGPVTIEVKNLPGIHVKENPKTIGHDEGNVYFVLIGINN